MKKYLILAAAAALFAACSNDGDLGDSPQVPEAPIPLTIGTSFGFDNQISNTRGVYTKLQGDSISLSNTVGLFIVSQGKTPGTNATTVLGKEDYEVNNVKMTAPAAASDYYSEMINSKSGKYGVLSAASTLYYPSDKNEQIALFAYAPHSDAATVTLGTINNATTSAAGTDLNANLLTITPNTDQSTNAKYVESDLLWGTQGFGNASGQEVTAFMYKEVIKSLSPNTTNLSFSRDATNIGKIVLPMQHVLSKVTINLFPSGMPLAKLQGAKVQIYVDYLDGTMNLTTGAVTKGTKSSSAQLVTLTDHLGLTKKTSGTEITKGNDGHPSNITYSGTLPTGLTSGSIEGYSASAVIIPQEVYDGLSDTEFIKITLSDGSTVYGFASHDIDMSTAGKEYTFNIMVTATGLGVAATVQDWGSTTSISGSAVLQ